jgi:peroxiredoxin Q/BCP
VQLQADLEKIEAAGLKVVAISYDSPEKLAAFAEKKSITFPLLSDPDSQTITAYGVLNVENPKQKIAHPTTFIVDQKQVIRAKLTKGGYAKRHTSEELSEAMQKLAEQKKQE